MITLTEILDRSTQGITRPFLCREGALIYFVKGRYAGQRSLCCEWVAGRIAQDLLRDIPLSIPPFTIADVPKALIEGSARPDAGDLGHGLAFASLQIEDAQELNWTSAQDWPEQVIAILLLLDLWLHNEDRSLSAVGGNPNLLVTQDPPPGCAADTHTPLRRLWAYDFNLAFDEDFEKQRFLDSHVFGGRFKVWPSGFRDAMEQRMSEILKHVPAFFEELPQEWLYLDGDPNLPVQLSAERVSSILSLPFTDPETFWRLP